MALGKKKILAAFLEKDNLKMLVYEVGGLKGQVSRLFAGQITFSPEVVRDGFIADTAKFDSQVKMAFAQKEALQQATEVMLFLSPDKSFTKTLPGTDTIDSFVHGLPYFREELIIDTAPAPATGGPARTTYVAFERKLVEDAQRPFLESGKKIIGVKSAASVLVPKFAKTGRYLFLIPLEKDLVMAVAENGEVADLAVVKNDLVTARLGEFLSSHDLPGATAAFSVGMISSALAQKLRVENGLNLVPLAQTDIYDLIISSVSSRGSKTKLPAFIGKLPTVSQKHLFLAGAIIVGAALTILIVKNIGSLRSIGGAVSPVKPVTPTPTPSAPPPPPPPKPGDYPVAVLNGTLVTGEAGRLADELKAEGFDITETKNATAAGFAATRLRATSTVPDQITAQLKTELLKTYDAVSIEPLASPSGKAVIEIIIGKKKSS